MGDEGKREIASLLSKFASKLRNIGTSERNNETYVQKVIHEYLREQQVKDFLRELGLLSCGLLLDNHWHHTFNFVFSPQTELSRYYTPYLWASEKLEGELDKTDNIRKGYSDLIHNLFAIVRDQQADELEDEHGVHQEEFFLNLPDLDQKSDDFNSKGKEFRMHYGIHYCPIGEILFYLYAWRFLSINAISSINSIYEPLTRDSIHNFYLSKIDLENKILDKSNQDESINDQIDPNSRIQSLWKSALTILYGEETNSFNWLDELKLLLLYDDESKCPTIWSSSVLLYIKQVLKAKSIRSDIGIEISELELLLQKCDIGELNLFLQKVVLYFFGGENTGSTAPSPEVYLGNLFRKTRFPIMPFYFWIALDQSPKAYLVNPIWSSPLYPAKYRYGKEEGKENGKEKETSIVGLAICAVAPIEEVDSTINSSITKKQDICTKNSETLIEVTNILAHPQVELSFYKPLADQMMKNRNQEAAISIMIRNLSHNLGSHVLANPGLTTRWQEDLDAFTTFNTYIQRRLDFLASYIKSSGMNSMPLLFINDVLLGFFSQKLMLTELLSSRNITLSNVKFIVKNKKTNIIYKYNNENEGFLECKEPWDDPIVNIPGGISGCHALYAILENIIRNSCKYGMGNDQENYTLTIEISEYESPTENERPECWMLTIWDNFSSDQFMYPANYIRSKLSEELINSRGEIIYEGHGIHEIKLCAKYLSSGNYFDSDISCFDNDYEDLYSKYLLSKRINPTIGINKSPVRCFVINPSDSSRYHLCYSLLLEKPKLIGIVDQDLSRNKRTQATHPSVFFYESIDSLAKDFPYLAVIQDYEIDAYIEEVLEQIGKMHQRLPYRLMVAVREKSGRKEIWNAKIAQRQKWKKYLAKELIVDKDMGFADGMIPYNRIHVVEFDYKTSLGQKFLGDDGDWENHILEIYRSWLNAFKEKPKADRWKILLSFDRSPELVKSSWSRQLDAYDDENIELYIYGEKSLENTKDAENEKLSSSHEEPFFGSSNTAIADLEDLHAIFRGITDDAILKEKEKKLCIVYDNHGRMIKKLNLDKRCLDDLPAIYHEFGSKQIALYQALSSPPQQPFSFKFFIYALLESSLFSAVIIDERVSEATIDKMGRLFTNEHDVLQRGKIFPIHSVSFFNGKTGHQTKNSLFVSKRIENAMKKNTYNFVNIRSLEESGLVIAKTHADIFVLTEFPADIMNATSEDRTNSFRKLTAGEADAFIIHEGVADIPSMRQLGKGGLYKQIYKLTPAVIRTSGRGFRSRNFSNELPFLELGILSSFTYQGLDKFNFGRAVLSCSGLRDTNAL